MPSTSASVFAIIVLALGTLYQVYVAPLVESGGLFRKVEPFGTEHCEAVEGLQACE
ncbi:hypothetical protein FRC08_015409, partial [Ceratobasidium sp. 394]